MGQLINAKCHNCDFESTSLYFGAGDTDHMFVNYTRCKYPALAPDKSDIVMHDISNRTDYEKSGYIFYDSEEMYDISSKKEKWNFEYRGHKITWQNIIVQNVKSIHYLSTGVVVGIELDYCKTF